MGFETVDTFLSATRSWTASGGRVFNLVQQLKLGTTNADDISPVTQHDDNRRRTGEIAQTLDHALIRMGNLSNLEMKGVVLDSGFTSLLQNLKQLKECSLERVCVENAGECRPMALLAVENLKLVSICWHGRNRDSEIVRACLRLKKLTISWHADRADEMDWGENWTQSTCSTLAITTRLAWPARGEQLRRHRVKFISMLRMFPSVIELHIHGSIPPFFETDTEKKPMLVKMVNYRGPIHFLNLSRALPKVRSLNLTDCGLLGQHFREETLHVEAVRELTLDIFSCEEEIVCRLISVMSKLERLKVNISDDVFEQVRGWFTSSTVQCSESIIDCDLDMYRRHSINECGATTCIGNGK
ncbi:hypothetical protein HHX47_DHR3001061 [Lentinula edodes]|nr:hypothetical protein HHX47_DHR3001061 [Lentinula edodes]